MGIEKARVGLTGRFSTQLPAVAACALAGVVLLSGWPRADALAKHGADGKKRHANARGAAASEVSPFELQLFALINKERKEHGVLPLKLSPRLSRVARRHSEEMRDRGYMGHISPVPARSTPRKRFKRTFAYEPYIIGENVARRAGPQWCLTAGKIEKTHQGLMGSTHHRENILRPEFQQVGIGISVNDSGHYWITELFVCVSAATVNVSPDK